MKISRRKFIAAAGALPLAVRCGGGSQRPNILLIMTDDQGWGDVGSHANPHLETPNLDRLAAAGARFERFYVDPVCAPTRASLLTGRYAARTGVHGVTRGRETMRRDEVTLAQILSGAGYATGCFGKWHNGAHYPYDPLGVGFDRFLGFCAGHWNNYFDTRLQRDDRMVRTEGYITDVLTDEALDFIETHAARPFFCYVPYNAPHSPWQVPDRYFEKYKAAGLDDVTACAYGMCENLDDNIGRLLEQLETLGLSSKTVVLFLTDNGPNSDRYNGDMRGRKGSTHEGGVRVPLFVRWPGQIAAGKRIDQISAHIDLVPTLLDLCRIPLPAGPVLDGISLAPLLRGETDVLPERSIYTFWSGRGAVRTSKFRLVVERSGEVQLYDMEYDPEQRNDLADLQPSLARELESQYRHWLEKVTARGFDPVPIPIGHRKRPEAVLPGHEALLVRDHGEGISYVGANGWANDWITNWTRTAAYAYWPVEIVEPGRFRFTLMYACPPGDVGAGVALEVAGGRLEGRIGRAHDPAFIPSPDRVPRKEVYEKVWASLPLGELELSAGASRLAIRALSIPGHRAFELKAVRVLRID